MSKRWLIASWMIASLLFAVMTTPMLAQDAAEEGAGMSSLDEELFNDLGSDLFDDIDLPAEAKAAPDDAKPPADAGMQTDGEDVGAEGSRDEAGEPRGFGADQTNQMQGEDPLTKIGGLMREVQKRIAVGQAESQTVAMQQEIIEEIEKLLEQQNNQNQNQSNSNSQNQNQQQNQQQQQQQNQSQSQQQQNQQQNQQQGGQQQPQQAGQQQSQQQQQGQSQTQPQQQQGGDSQPSQAQMQPGEKSDDAQDSSDKLRDGKVLAISPEEQDALVKKAWGNLPPHLRKQISNSSMERFLPKYERLTQEYFRKLAEIEE
ncbi:hypothetical protein Pan97_11960 [Bremerella volcania]|uniref:Uncharacterized protein n=1 Tax=Bremerella volcania TaxID=2527984 RepID=A0A518C4P9_9BACT|nr:hypothetical protein [Bremerella volcania]QDU74191.1 hypothetical protein Pan97_11960 [Bremerella volcania]